MKSMTELKQAVISHIDANRERILAIAEDILHHPEPGYMEFRTAELVKNEFLKLGLTPDMVLIDVEEAMEAMGEVTGATVREDITARIFERFCVGK